MVDITKNTRLSNLCIFRVHCRPNIINKLCILTCLYTTSRLFLGEDIIRTTLLALECFMKSQNNKVSIFLRKLKERSGTFSLSASADKKRMEQIWKSQNRHAGEANNVCNECQLKGILK